MSAGVYVPRAKLLAQQAEQAALASGAAPSPAAEPTAARSAGYTEGEVQAFSEARRYFYALSPTFKELQEVKKAFNENPDVEAMFNRNREHSFDKPISQTFADQFYTCMGDIDETAGNLLNQGRVKRYCDFGASPGGWSTWVSKHNPDAKGLGITLPPSMAGLPMVSFPQGDYNVRYRDITKLEEVEYEIKAAGMEEVDLVMAAAIYRDQHTTESREPGHNEHVAPLAARTVLSISQIILALRHLQAKGNFVFVLSNKPDPATIQALVLLRSLFKSIIPCKGKSLHGIRSSFYLFCEDFDRQQYLDREIEELLAKALEDIKEEEDKLSAAAIEQVANRTADLSLDGADKPAEGAVHPADFIWLPDYTTQSLLEKEGQFVADFFEGLWWGQIKAINKRTDELKYKKSQHGNGPPAWMRGGRDVPRGSPAARDGWRASGSAGGGDRRTAGGGPAQGASEESPRRTAFGGGGADWRKR